MPPSGSQTPSGAAGLENVAVEETTFHPVVYADWLHAEGAPTALVYGHYDVQPVDPLDLWTSPPFEPVVVDGRMLARGAADDKGQVHAHAMAAAAILATRGGFPINVRYVFEGAEESGSEGLDAWLTANRDRLTADVAIISDTGFFEGNIPAITVGLRGLMYAQIDVVGSPVDLHSGSYGGAVQNPANALAGIIAALKGPDGRIRIPGFYDAVVALTDEEHAAIAELPFDEDDYRERRHVGELVGEVGYSTLERRATRPTLDVNGLWGGFQGHGTKTIIPAHAHAKVSCRLVPAQEPARHLREVPRLRARDRAARGEGHGPGPRRRAAQPDAHRPSDDQGRRAGARSHVRSGAGLHPRGRVDPGDRQLRIDPRLAGRPAGLRAAERQRPRPGRMDVPGQLRRRDPGDRAPRSTRSPRSERTGPE